MKHTIFNLSAAAALAFAIGGAGQTALGQASDQITTGETPQSTKYDQSGTPSKGDKSYDKTSDKAAREDTSQGDKSYDKTSDRDTREGATQSDKSYDKTSDRDTQKAASQVEKSYGDTNDTSAAGAYRSEDAVKGNSDAISQGVRQTDRSQASQQQAPALAVQGNMANHYDGRWSSASSHSDWDQQTDHQWNNHDYRWYDGGWLIIDTGYAAPGYNTTDSVPADVQTSLARQGYYDGPIDGYIGRGTRHAIAHYESDKGLQVNGRIDGPLLVSLGLQ
ncbi:MAG: peptidoglycan-binding protein [Chthoniobacteraceae bacterium]|jgi:hypothetical protein